MTVQLFARRSLVVIGVIASLAVGASAIQAAGEWTAAAAPLQIAPASITSIQAALAGEQERSAALEEQLATLQTATSELGAALTAAQGQVETDATSAAALRADLEAAQAKLKTVEAALAKAAKAAKAATAASSGNSSSSPAATPTPTREHDDD
ncbi:MAG: hypothetical protein ABI555_08185 [Chloroflexota bacterium]